MNASDLGYDAVSRETGHEISKPAVRWVTDRGLRLNTGAATLSALNALRESGLPEIEEVVPADGSLLVVLKAGVTESAALYDILKDIGGIPLVSAGCRHEIPMRFDGEDLPVIAEYAGMGASDLIEHFLQLEFSVRFLGFQPGFAYLEGLPPALQIPRRDCPRKQVARGSVALGGGYCGIYPATGPGGWHLIGHADACLFDPVAKPAARLQPGDSVRFVRA